MQIYDTGIGNLRDMTDEEEYMANNLPDPEEQISEEEIISIILEGGTT